MNTGFQKGKKIIETLKDNGYEAYFVGGYVRDFLLKRKTNDIDIATSAKPEQVQEIFPKVIPVGIEHGTVIVRMQGESFEVTTFREESSYSDFRHPDQVQFVHEIEKDLSRRDFTMNAIAMDETGNLFDPFNGQADLTNQQIRTVREPSLRFQEDPLRIMRAARFVSQLGFHVEPNSKKAMKEYGPLLANISIERIVQEFEKLLAGRFVERGLQLFFETRLASQIPVIQESGNIQDRIRALSKPLGHIRELLTLCHFLDDTIGIRVFGQKWKLSRHTQREAEQLVTATYYFQEHGLDAWMIYQLPASLDESFIRVLDVLNNHTISLDSVLEIRRQLPIKERKQLSINGTDLASWFPQKQKGPWIGMWTEAIEHAVVIGKQRNDKKKIKEWVLSHGEHPPTNY
ncbi:CCA tRNA nucleotidyltransferase [Radiobacillus kanasensis]|uniref:CCA tRNA nucleotidyltransferase n=1 Tax=Radiobacillus kanasensis TaxID=2844358 RepID=UPI001E365D59|nr:CCA tRNA nucleotidyltransferase [Radiobacillus kanasensis]UFU01285.1 CCA tRNA nucleotidyltransferase [Radiobacillus kanasensis]